MKTYLQRFMEAREGYFTAPFMKAVEEICKDADWKCTFLKNDNERLNNLLVELNRDVKSLKNEIKELKDSKDTAHCFLQKADNKIKELKDEIEALKEQNAALLGEVAEKNTVTPELQYYAQKVQALLKGKPASEVDLNNFAITQFLYFLAELHSNQPYTLCSIMDLQC